MLAINLNTSRQRIQSPCNYDLKKFKDWYNSSQVPTKVSSSHLSVNDYHQKSSLFTFAASPLSNTTVKKPGSLNTQQVQVILNKMEMLQEKISKIENRVAKENNKTLPTKVIQSHYHTSKKPKKIIKVHKPALTFSAFSSQKVLKGVNKLQENEGRSHVNSVIIGRELDEIQQKIISLSKRKEILLNSLEKTQKIDFDTSVDSRKPTNTNERGYLCGILKNDLNSKKLDISKRLIQDVNECGSSIENASRILSLNSRISRQNQPLQFYTGDIINGNYEGKGKLTNHKYMPSSQDLKDTLADICFEQQNSNWLYYEGYFKQNKFDGQGNLYLGDVYKINGTFREGKAHGSMQIINKKIHQIVFKGIFKHGYLDMILDINQQF